MSLIQFERSSCSVGLDIEYKYRPDTRLSQTTHKLKVVNVRHRKRSLMSAHVCDVSKVLIAQTRSLKAYAPAGYSLGEIFS